jgi:signal recognition particle receptor subunit beta
MSFVNFQKREIAMKVVYYGAAESGKTTNLSFLHSSMQPELRGDMISLDTEGERTLFFDFFPISLGEVMGFKVKFQLYTVPGQSYYQASRRLVLDGADGIVFVIDSQWKRFAENIASWNDLVENMNSHGMTREKVPVILQYNKRDLPEVITVGALERRLGLTPEAVFEASALRGQGVMNSIRWITKAAIQRFTFER